MKGFTKAIMRTPHMVTSKVGMSKKSSDPEFDELNRKMTTLESSIEKFVKDTKAFTEGVTGLLTGAENWAQHFESIFSPLASEYDLIGKHPEAADAIRNVGGFQACNSELRSALAPELELIESRITAPAKELQGLMKTIRKNITKRDHKLVDFDRHNNSLNKLREKKEKSLNDEKNLFKLEQDFEQASTDYEFWNTAMKTELPQFFVLCTRFIDPLFHSFFYMQLNIFYITLEKVQAFASGKFDLSGAAADIVTAYEERLGDARDTIDNLNINKRMVSSARLVQTARQNSLQPGSSLGRAPSSASTLNRGPSTASSFKKAPPPPPPSSSHAAAAAAAPPPPYSAGASPTATSAAVGAKRPPPPIPASKPKPKPAVQYVVALYDFAAQADGDLSFSVGDRIEIVKRTPNQEDWWTGRVNGQEGVFPGNYVQDE
ncbi:BAR-domain-containing protein [Clavulina sp. PMI_390]|nr:BAR-domain-containing protein [Clavulina sp. PMI_390]